MCTASWLSRPGGFELYFNRDEAPSRLEARPPEPFLVEGTRCLAPIDADAGGTWLGVNEHGLAVGLLNAWERGREPDPPVVSRGELVKGLLASRSQAEVQQRLADRDLGVFRGFRLAVFAPGAEPRVHAWLGGRLESEDVRLPLASSSLGAEQAHAIRREVLFGLSGEAELDSDVLATFHRSHAPERGVWSPCMHREEASTVSLSHVEVGPEEVTFRYAPGPPCRTPLGPRVRLERSSQAPPR